MSCRNIISPVLGLPLTLPWKWAWNPGRKRESPVLLAGTCSERCRFSLKTGEKAIFGKRFLIWAWFICDVFILKTWLVNYLKGNYDVKFLEAIDFAFKKCQFNFVPKAEQAQAIHAVVSGNDGWHTKVWNFMVNSQVNSCMTLAQEIFRFWCALQRVFMKNPCENSFEITKKYRMSVDEAHCVLQWSVWNCWAWMWIPQQWLINVPLELLFVDHYSSSSIVVIW